MKLFVWYNVYVLGHCELVDYRPHYWIIVPAQMNPDLTQYEGFSFGDSSCETDAVRVLACLFLSW